MSYSCELYSEIKGLGELEHGANERWGEKYIYSERERERERERDRETERKREIE